MTSLPTGFFIVLKTEGDDLPKVDFFIKLCIGKNVNKELLPSVVASPKLKAPTRLSPLISLAYVWLVQESKMSSGDIILLKAIQDVVKKDQGERT